MTSPSGSSQRKGKFGKPVLHASDPPAVAAARTDGSDIPVNTEEIARLAYSYWDARGCQGGSAEEDWLRAEQELRSRK